MRTLPHFSVLLFACLFVSVVFASGNFKLVGKVRNFSSESVDIEDAKKIYTINRKKIGADQDKQIAAAKVGTELKLQVPFVAVDDVKLKSEKK